MATLEKRPFTTSALIVTTDRFIARESYHHCPDRSLARLGRMGVWSQAGPVASIQGGNVWWAAVPEEDRPKDESFDYGLSKIWDPQVGDCRQELVLIGVGMDTDRLHAQLSRCLLTDAEMELGPSYGKSSKIQCQHGPSSSAVNRENQFSFSSKAVPRFARIYFDAKCIRPLEGTRRN